MRSSQKDTAQITEPGIGTAELNVARKIVRTLCPRYQITRHDRHRLLNLLTAIALDDLIEAGAVQWKGKSQLSGRLHFRRGTVRLEPGRDLPLFQPELDEAVLEEYLDEVEEILDRYGLAEEERVALFTAFPCLGMAALQSRLIEWCQSPPFLGLG